MKVQLDWDEPYEDPDPTCPACEGPMSACSCEDTVIVRALEPHFDRDGDDPGRITGRLKPSRYAQQQRKSA